MQKKMKLHQMPEADADAFLETAEVGRLGTIGPDGYPYIVPLHFAVMDGNIYAHGLNAGDKVENIGRNAKVSFEADSMQCITHGDSACGTGTWYKSVIIKGDATIVSDRVEMEKALTALTHKYAPQHASPVFPEAMLAVTAVIRITVAEKTGKIRK